MSLRVICRTLVLDQGTARLLLVRNKGAEYWYAPGGGWDHEDEGLEECAIRETEEETGIVVQTVRLLYVQEFRPDNNDVHIELFWFAYPISSTDIKEVNDAYGIVEEARWLSKDELQPLTVFPARLKDLFWHELASAITSPNPFLK